MSKNNIPDQIQIEFDAMEQAGIKHEIREAKGRRLIYVEGEFCAHMPHGIVTRGVAIQNAVAGIRRAAKKHHKPETFNTVTEQPKEKKDMTQSQEMAALNGRIGSLEQGLQAVLKLCMGISDELKIARALLEDCVASSELTVAGIGHIEDKLRDMPRETLAPTLPRGWLQGAIRELMKDGEHRHIFEIWKTLKEKYPDLSEASTGSALANMADDDEIKRLRQGVYYMDRTE